MLHKYFHILEVNLDKYVRDFDVIFSDFEGFIKKVKGNKVSIEVYIYICDNIKQILLKFLKMTSKK